MISIRGLWFTEIEVDKEQVEWECSVIENYVNVGGKNTKYENAKNDLFFISFTLYQWFNLHWGLFDLLDILYKTLQNDVVLCLRSRYTKLTFQETNIPT